MKRIVSILATIFVVGLLAAPGPLLRAQQTAAPASRQANQGPVKAEHMDADSSETQYTHAAVVQAIARHLHVSTDFAADIFEDFNSGVILLAIAWLLWKALPKLFRGRSERLAKSLEEARRATEEANRLLAQVEARLSRLDTEIESMRAVMERDSAEEEKRILAAMEAERQRIITSAEQEIAAAQAGAQRDLKKFAADLAIDNAMRRIQLSVETDRALVKEFGEGMGPGGKA
ncbi:MAG TPA: ATP synthase F0 subunit B [Acidobacteriaceae bacterium]|nr:ATP synthase F0 subunit B [Acidobacteriaceae bacterium]